MPTIGQLTDKFEEDLTGTLCVFRIEQHRKTHTRLLAPT